MTNSIREMISSLFGRMHRGVEFGELDNETRERYLAVVEKVVDGTDTNIRLVPGYKNKLLGSVKQTLEYVDQLVDQFSSPIEIDSRAFASDPYVNAFFATPRDLESTIEQSSEVNDYVASGGTATSPTSCIVLCMQMEEKQVLGMGMSDGQLRKDVMQTAISFHDHRIYSPAATESDARNELKCCIFQGVISNALANISEFREKRRQLETEQQTLVGRMRNHGKSSNDITLEEKLEQTRKALNNLGLLTPQASLDKVNSIMGNPEDFVRLRKRHLLLNKMGIVVNSDSDQPTNELHLTEVIIHGQVPRIVSLAMIDNSRLSNNT